MITDAANRTNLELKPPNANSATPAAMLPIVPIWNWNEYQRSCQRNFLNLPIVPIWNWNWVIPHLLLHRCRLPSVPIWNWNSIIRSSKRSYSIYQSYQSGIETGESFNNWCFHFFYQSYQSGIETVAYCTASGSFSPYQSYQSGIETMFESKINLQIKHYQSYQSGIETTERVKNRNGRFTTNRTNLELKHGSGGWWLCWT